jgi:Tfp pilus assembly protein FimT
MVVVAFLALLICLAVAMIRDWSDKKNGLKESQIL